MIEREGRKFRHPRTLAYPDAPISNPGKQKSDPPKRAGLLPNNIKKVIHLKLRASRQLPVDDYHHAPLRVVRNQKDEEIVNLAVLYLIFTASVPSPPLQTCSRDPSFPIFPTYRHVKKDEAAGFAKRRLPPSARWLSLGVDCPRCSQRSIRPNARFASERRLRSRGRRQPSLSSN